jgi:hypothetical protein
MISCSRTLAILLLAYIGPSNYAYSYYNAAHFSNATTWLPTAIEPTVELAGTLRRTIENMAKDAAKIEHNRRLSVPDDSHTAKEQNLGHVVDPDNEASVRKSFVMSKEGQAEISSAIQNQDVQVFGTERELFFTRSVPISQLPADDQGRLTALFKELVNDLPEEEFKSSESLTKAMRRRLERQLAESSSQVAPRYKFDVSSGKLTLPRLGSIGSLEISGGELDRYKLLKGIALVAIACGATGCKCFVGALLGVDSMCVPVP